MREEKSMKKYVIGRMVDFDHQRIVGDYAYDVMHDYVHYMVDGKKHEFEGLDWFECEIWNRWGAEIVPEAAVERVVW